VRRGGDAAVAVVATEIHVFVLLFRRNRLSVFLTHGWEARRRLAEKNERSARRWEFVGEARPVPNTHYRLARSRAPNGRKRPVQRTVRSCTGQSTRERVVECIKEPVYEYSGPARTAMVGCQECCMLFDFKRH
jgi:hypothetical protein